jgi:hypothetical protein
MSDDDPILVCCPYCVRSLGTIEEPDAAFTVPAKCPRCGMDPRKDAPLEMPLSAWGLMSKKRCPHCGKDVPKLAVRCGHCAAAISTPAKKTAKKPAKKRGA